MAGSKIMAVLLGVMAVIAVSGSIGAAYACYETPPYRPQPPGRMNLEIMDQDESWKDGVRETWMASNMAPGDEFDFNGCFVGLRSRSRYTFNQGVVGITCDYEPWTASQPDKMARYMVITRCTYDYTYWKDKWQIDLLTGRATQISKKGNTGRQTNRDWQIQDVDRDGRATFYDLKQRPLKNLPLLTDDEARFEMGVVFHQDAGNEFQGDTFTLTMTYTLTAR